MHIEIPSALFGGSSIVAQELPKDERACPNLAGLHIQLEVSITFLVLQHPVLIILLIRWHYGDAFSEFDYDATNFWVFR